MITEIITTLKKAEHATILYVYYIEQQGNDWDITEMEIAKETLGMLTLFCHQLNHFKKLIEVHGLDKESSQFLNQYIPKVELSSSHIIDYIEDFVEIPEYETSV